MQFSYTLLYLHVRERIRFNKMPRTKTPRNIILPRRSEFTEQCIELSQTVETVKTTGRRELAKAMLKQFTNTTKGLEKIAEWAKKNPGTYDEIVEKASGEETTGRARAARA